MIQASLDLMRIDDTLWDMTITLWPTSIRPFGWTWEITGTKALTQDWDEQEKLDGYAHTYAFWPSKDGAGTNLTLRGALNRAMRSIEKHDAYGDNAWGDGIVRERPPWPPLFQVNDD